MTNRRMLAAVLTITTCCACSERTASSAVSELSANAERPASDVDPELQDAIPHGATPAQLLELKARKYAAGFVADGEAITGTLGQGGRNDHLAVLAAGRCYRIVGVGGEGVEDMDLFLYDPDGVQVQQDPGQDRFPALGAQSEVCPLAGGAYRVQVHMYRGGGPYALRVYRSP